jgi:hypothetical protein
MQYTKRVVVGGGSAVHSGMISKSGSFGVMIVTACGMNGERNNSSRNNYAGYTDNAVTCQKCLNAVERKAAFVKTATVFAPVAAEAVKTYRDLAAETGIAGETYRANPTRANLIALNKAIKASQAAFKAMA